MKNNLRNDLSVIAKLIQKEEKVLDVGCGDGKLLDFLSKTKNVNCRGIELKQNVFQLNFVGELFFEASERHSSDRVPEYRKMVINYH